MGSGATVEHMRVPDCEKLTLRLPEIDVQRRIGSFLSCLLYTSDAADERSSVDLGGRRIIKKKHDDRTIGARAQQIKNKAKH